MSDQSQNADGAAAENDDEEFELEGDMDREQGAAVLRRLADGVESGTVELGGDEGAVTLPERFEVEVEFEEEDDEQELEVEFEWSTDNGESAEEDEEDEDAETEASEAEADEAEGDDDE